MNFSGLRGLLPVAGLLMAGAASAQLAVPYTATGTYQVPPGVTAVEVECWGGGGRGATRTSNGPGAGGGGGAYASGSATVTGGSTYTVTVGAGSTGTGPGGDSWFRNATTVMAKGGASAGNNSTEGANGGSGTSSVGTVRRNGGNGAHAPGFATGGGGSSAAPGSHGTNATGTAGATAPAGGGDGGDGWSGSQGHGSDGAFPGGGGGGARRSSFGTRAGGDGGNGLVIVKAPYVEGDCYSSSAAYNAIADNGCASNATTRVGITRSGLPTALGTAPGNARLMSVELIIVHTYNADLEVRLTSPSGQTRNLVLDRFGSANNMGNPGTCVPLMLEDGASALVNSNVGNATGPYAPEETLAGFTGDPNGTWTLSICDDAGDDLGYFRMVRLNFCTVPEITATSNGSPVCAGDPVSLGVTATGTAPLSYAWAGTGSFSPDNASASVTVNGAATGDYSITVSNGCGQHAIDVPVTVTPQPSATVGYGAMPRCRTEGTIAVSLTGTSGGSFSAGAGLAINSSTGAIDLNASTAGTYTVTYTVAAAGGCPLYSTQTSVELSEPDTWYADVDGDGFGDPGSTQLSCDPVPGHVLNSTDDCPSFFGLIGDPCDDGNADTVDDELTPACACVGINQPWYSQGNGMHGDALWSHAISGPGEAVTFSSTSRLIVQGGHTITLGASVDLAELTVEAGASVEAGAHALTLHGQQLVVNGTLNGTDALLRIESAAPFTVSGAGTMEVRDLEVDAAAGLTQGVSTRILGTLLLEDGAFTAMANTRLVSNASGTARLGPVGSGASYLGDLIVERYIPGGATNWRLLGSPVAGNTVFHWKDDFFMAGFPGSHYPSFNVGGQPWPSVRRYDEPAPGADMNIGLVGVAGISEALNIGRGYAAWSGDLGSGTAAFTVDVKGNPTVAQSPLSLPMSWTDSGNPAADGWNLVSNPLPSPIDFEAVQRGADVADQYWLFDPATGNNVSWSNGIGVGAANGIIQSSQGFWLKADGPAVTTTVDESAKVLAGTGGAFGGDQELEQPVLRLRLTSGVNSFSDEAVVVFAEGTPAFDPIDAPQFVFAHPQAPQLAVRSVDGVKLSIDFFGGYDDAVTIPVLLNAAVTGTYTVTAELGGQHPLSCISIEDLATGAIVHFGNGASYTFELHADDDPEEPRLLLHASAPMALNVQQVACHGGNGSATIEVGSGPVDLNWSREGGPVQSLVAVSGSVNLGDLQAGDYTFEISTGTACGQLQGGFTITQPFAMEGTVVGTASTSCPASADGAIEVQVLGGVAPYSFQWSNGSDAELLVAAPGSYDLTVTDANGCSLILSDLQIAAGDGPVAGIAVAPTVLVGEPLTFESTASGASSWSWDFGDGNTSEEEMPAHSYALPGTYTVGLTVSDGNCSSMATTTVEVEGSTGVADVQEQPVRAWVRDADIVVDYTPVAGMVRVELYDARGRLVLDQLSSAAAGRTVLRSVRGAGIWNLRVTLGDRPHAVRVLMAH